MNPCDALKKDYGMYYNGCWMRHKTLGIGRIMIDGTRMLLEYTASKSGPVAVKPASLSCWWPRAGAFNAGTGAVYIARRAIRNMRKSAVSGDHYFVKWGAYRKTEPMLLLRDGPNHVRLTTAMTRLDTKKWTAVAVTRDIILHLEDDNKEGVYTVVFRGIEVGRLKHGMFEATVSDNPLTGRVLRQLEGIL